MKIALRTATAIGVASCFGAAHADLVNPGFETGDFGGWALSFNSSSAAVQSAVVHSGNFAASFAPAADACYLDQVIPTNPGQAYHISFWLKSEGGSSTEFTAWADGNNYIDSFDNGAFDWTEFTHDFVASGTSADIEFSFRNDDGNHWFLDDAHTVVPEPATLALLGLGAGALLKRRRK